MAKRLLVLIEDDPDLAETLSVLFEMDGYEVRRSDNLYGGRQILEKAAYERSTIDGCIFDLMFPDSPDSKSPSVNAGNMMEHLKAYTQATGHEPKVIIHSGTPDIAVKVAEEYRAKFIQKPASAYEMRDYLES